jgi:phage shock protein C
MDNIFYFPKHIFYSFPFQFDWDLFWPILLILVGVLYLIHINQKGKAKKTEPNKQETVAYENGKKLLRSRTDRKISGVCGGLAAYFDIDSTIIRILWVILTLFVGAVLLGIIAYIVMAIFIPDER